MLFVKQPQVQVLLWQFVQLTLTHPFSQHHQLVFFPWFYVWDLPGAFYTSQGNI